MSFTNIIITLIISTVLTAAGDLPDFIRVCHRSDPEIEKCLMDSIEHIKPFLVKGVPEYNVPSLEPMLIDELINEEGAGMKILISNVRTYGSSQFVVESIQIDQGTNTYIIHINIPQLRIESDYSIDGKIIVLPVKGKGNFEGNLTNCKSISTITGEIYDKGGVKYLQFVSNKLKVSVGSGSIRLENLFNGDKVLLGMINDAINKNLDMFMDPLMPVVEKALADEFLEVANDIVKPFTFDELFPL